MIRKGVYEINKRTKKLIRKVKGCDLNYFNFYHNPNEGKLWFYLDKKNEKCKENNINSRSIDHVRFNTEARTFTMYITVFKSYKTGGTHEKCDKGSRIPGTYIYTKKNCRQVPSYYTTTSIKKFVTVPYIELKQMDCCVEMKYDENEVIKAVRAYYKDCYDVSWSQITMHNRRDKNILTAHFYYLESRPDGDFCYRKMKL